MLKNGSGGAPHAMLEILAALFAAQRCGFSSSNAQNMPEQIGLGARPRSLLLFFRFGELPRTRVE
jgi:hypothetical protein